MRIPSAICLFLLPTIAVSLALDDGKVSAPLASWRDNYAKKAITEYVLRVTDEKSPDFVPAP